jgi:hypothetical protein
MSDTFADLQLAAERATPGEWKYDMGSVTNRTQLKGGCMMQPGTFKVADIRGWGFLQYRPDGEQLMEANGEFIALANPSRILALIKRCRDTEMALEDIRGLTDPNNIIHDHEDRLKVVFFYANKATSASGEEGKTC